MKCRKYNVIGSLILLFKKKISLISQGMYIDVSYCLTFWKYNKVHSLFFFHFFLALNWLRSLHYSARQIPFFCQQLHDLGYIFVGILPNFISNISMNTRSEHKIDGAKMQSGQS